MKGLFFFSRAFGTPSIEPNGSHSQFETFTTGHIQETNFRVDVRILKLCAVADGNMLIEHKLSLLNQRNWKVRNLLSVLNTGENQSDNDMLYSVFTEPSNGMTIWYTFHVIPMINMRCHRYCKAGCCENHFSTLFPPYFRNF